MTTDPVTIAAQYGLAGFLALIIGWIIYRVGLRMVAALDALVDRVGKLSKEIDDKIDEHTKTDVEHHNEVQRHLVHLGARIDTALELTPPPVAVPTPPRRVKTNPQGLPVGRYGPVRPPRDDSDD